MRSKLTGTVLLAIMLTVLPGCGDDNSIQSNQVTWYTEIGTAGMDYANDIVATDDGGFVIAGYTDNNPTVVSDAMLAKVDGGGNLVWQRLFGGEYRAWANAVTAAHGGGYVAAGHIMDLNDPPGDIYIFKIDEDGGLLWERRFGGDGYDIVADIVTTSDGGYVAAGTNEVDSDIHRNNIYLVKLDADGNRLWEKTIGQDTDTDTQAFAQTPDGGFVIVDVGFDISSEGNHYTYIIYRTSSEGDILYKKVVAAVLAESCDRILPTPDGGFLLLGRARYNCQYALDRCYGINLMKIDAEANLVWAKTIDIGDEDTPYGIAAIRDEGFVITGTTYDYDDGNPRFTFLVKITEDGTPLWEQSFIFDHRIYGNAVASCSDGGVAVAGSVYLPESGYDAFVMKVDANGVLSSE